MADLVLVVGHDTEHLRAALDVLVHGGAHPVLVHGLIAHDLEGRVSRRRTHGIRALIQRRRLQGGKAAARRQAAPEPPPGAARHGRHLQTPCRHAKQHGRHEGKRAHRRTERGTGICYESVSGSTLVGLGGGAALSTRRVSQVSDLLRQSESPAGGNRRLKIQSEYQSHG